MTVLFTVLTVLMEDEKQAAPAACTSLAARAEIGCFRGASVTHAPPVQFMYEPAEIAVGFFE